MFRYRTLNHKTSSRRRWLLLLVLGISVLGACTQGQPVNASADSACSDVVSAIADFRLAYSNLDVDADAIEVIKSSGAALDEGPLRDAFASLATSMGQLSQEKFEPGKVLTYKRDAAELSTQCLESVSPDLVEGLSIDFLTALY